MEINITHNAFCSPVSVHSISIFPHIKSQLQFTLKIQYVKALKPTNRNILQMRLAFCIYRINIVVKKNKVQIIYHLF